MSMDQVPVPSGEKLWIGGIFSLKAKSALEAAGITHVVSVLRMRLDRKMFETDRQEGGGGGLLKRLMIEANDVEEENLIQHFAGANEFIVDAHANGGAVLIHCAMGKSRSATVLAAYLMWSQKLDRDSALALIRKYRPYAEPNPGFMEQLDVYYRIGYTQSPDDHPIYQRWLYKMELQSSRAGGRAPERVHFRDVERKVAGIIEAGEGDMTKDSETTVELRCRRCRHTLGNSHFFTGHLPKTTLDGEFPNPHPPPALCSHHFIEPLSWMRSELEQGKLEGKLECPKCKSKVGSYAWQGIRCSCSHWVVPGISLARSKVDEVRVNRPAAPQGLLTP